MVSFLRCPAKCCKELAAGLAASSRAMWQSICVQPSHKISAENGGGLLKLSRWEGSRYPQHSSLRGWERHSQQFSQPNHLDTINPAPNHGWVNKLGQPWAKMMITKAIVHPGRWQSSPAHDTLFVESTLVRACSHHVLSSMIYTDSLVIDHALST